MPKPLPDFIKSKLKQYDMPQDSVWNCHGTWIATHKALEKVAINEGIQFDKPDVHALDMDKKTVVLFVTGRRGDKSEWSFGEASPANNKNSYPVAMAEKRAKDRVILKLLGLHGDLYSDVEADEFSKRPPQRQTVKKAQSKGRDSKGAFWVRESLAIPIKKSSDGGYLFFKFQEQMGKAIQNCPDLSSLDRLLKDNGNNISTLNEAQPQRGEAINEAVVKRRGMLLQAPAPATPVNQEQTQPLTQSEPAHG